MIKTAKKYILAFGKEKEAEILNKIEEFGCFELVANKKEGTNAEELRDLDYLISSLNFAISYLTPLSKKDSFLKKLKNPYILVQKDKINLDKKILKQRVERIIEIEKKEALIKKEKKELKQKIGMLSHFGNLDFIPEDTEYSFSKIISCNQEEKITELSLKNSFYQRKLSSDQSQSYFLLVGFKKDKEKILQVLKQEKVEIIEYAYENNPKKEMVLAKERRENREKRQDELQKELSQAALSMEYLKTSSDFLLIEKSKKQIQSESLDQGLLNYLCFWGMEKDKKRLRKELKDIQIIEEVTDEEPPVVLENSKLITPFEYVTDIFGLPKGNEIDPTPYLSFFFILFFGICITDAGYGLLLALVCGSALIFLKDTLGKNKLIKLLFYGGISTFVVGILFGSYFGVTPEFGKPLKLIDPIEDTVLFMGITFFLGYIQIMLSQIVRIISGKRNKDKEALWGGVAWTVTYLSMGVMLLSFKVPVLKNIGLFGIVLSGLGLLVVESRNVKIYLKPLVGLVKILQGLIGTMSDILSYSRLMALGLATAVIALIVNQIAGLFSGLIPFVGFLVGGVILIGGHLFNLGINALSGFIHSGRLQFVEFFPKFLEGGGRRFKPLRSELKYTKIC